jgi:hypothetical protein
MKKAEIIIAALSIVAIGFNLLLIPGGAFLTVLTLSTLSIIYMYLSFAIFNDIRFRKIFRKESYAGISTMRIVGAVATGLALSMTTIGMLFKFQSWPGASFNLFVGLSALLIVTVIAVIKYLKTRSAFYTGVFKRVAVFGMLGLILLFIPNANLLEIKYRNQPAYLNALKSAMADPQNKSLWDKVEEERQKMYYGKKE